MAVLLRRRAKMVVFGAKSTGVLVFLCCYMVATIVCEDAFFLKAAKSVPRIGKRSKNNLDDTFEKFFLKASKSVPRIGRRGPAWVSDDDVTMKGMFTKYPTWSELSERFEADPELFTYPERLEQLAMVLGDDPSVYAADRVRLKRRNVPTTYEPNRELTEYRMQADNYM